MWPSIQRGDPAGCGPRVGAHCNSSRTGADHPPGQQGVEIVGGGGVGAERRGRDERRCLGPVLAPVVGAVRAQASGDGLAVHHSSWLLSLEETPPTQTSCEQDHIARNDKRRRRRRDDSILSFLTLFPGVGDDVGGALAHHLGDVERAVGLIGHGDGAVHRLRLHLWCTGGNTSSAGKAFYPFPRFIPPGGLLGLNRS